MNSSTVKCEGQAKRYTRRSESWDLEDMVAEWCSVLPDVRREGIRCRLREEEEEGGKEPENNWLQALENLMAATVLFLATKWAQFVKSDGALFSCQVVREGMS